jgi:serine/threonine-protein kinase
MATVYAATHRNRNRVAIKLLHAELSVDEGVRSRFLREGYAANTIDHPGTVRVLDDDVTEDGLAFLVMELLDGESVEERAVRKGGRLSVEDVLDIANQLLAVLQAAHDHGIVHRDIKPDNLFVAQGGQLKVLDFGIARMRQGSTGSTRVGSFMGTPAFSAPEQARGRWNEVDGRSDIFAVGATLFSTLTGRPVHEAETPSEQLALAISTPAPGLRSVLPDVPEDVALIVDRALSYDKVDRWPSARDMQEAVSVVLRRLPVRTPLSSPPRRKPPSETDRTAETLVASSPASSRGSISVAPSVGALTTTPASPQALASMRRIAAGVLLAGGTGLAVGLGSWWLAQGGGAVPAPNETVAAGSPAAAQASEASVVASVQPSSPASAVPVAVPPGEPAADAVQKAVAKDVAPAKGKSGPQASASASAVRVHTESPVPPAQSTTPARPASPAGDDLFDNRY